MGCCGLILFFGATLIAICGGLTSFGCAGEKYEYKVNDTTNIRIVFNTSTSRYPSRVNVWIDDAVDSSVLVALGQRTKVTSWQLPYVLPTSNHSEVARYNNMSKILCYDEDERNLSDSEFNSGKRNFTISLSTESSEYITVFVYVEILDNFFIEDNKKYAALVSPSRPIYYSYDYPVDFHAETVALKVHSEKESCVVVSIQRKICPVEDLNYELAPGGMFQTVKSKGGLHIWKHLFPNGFYLVFNVKADNQTCNSEKVPISKALFPSRHRVKILFEILDGKTKGGYTKPILFVSIQLIVTAALCCGLLYFIWKRNATNISSNNPNETEEHTWKYFSHTFAISGFYCVPVFQLMIFYKMSIDDSGNLDKCYYNFWCSHPWYFNDINHMFSNVGYLFFGLTFIIVVKMNKKYKRNSPDCGLERHSSLYYAMGLALILEGVLSCIYHICPNQSNFQFDTSFMYVMIVLMMAKLYQNRHCNKMDQTSYVMFVLLSVIIFLVSWETFLKSFDWAWCNALRIVIRTIFNLIHIGLSLYIGYITYYKGVPYIDKSNARNNEEELHKLNEVEVTQQAEASNQCGDPAEIRKKELTQEEIQRAKVEAKEKLIEIGNKIIKLKRIFVIIEVLMNVVILILVYLVHISKIDFASYILHILVANAFLYVIYYCCMKYSAEEKVNNLAWCLAIFSAFIWVPAIIFFTKSAAEWSKTPAESRELNTECYAMMGSFYDTHDLWHLLSAVALFLSFSFLLVLDDDLLNKTREKLFCSI